MRILLNLIEIDINLITAKGAQGGAKPTLLSLFEHKTNRLGAADPASSHNTAGMR